VPATHTPSPSLIYDKVLRTAQEGHVVHVAQVVFAEGLYPLSMYMHTCCK
jgi:hypothetical protein